MSHTSCDHQTRSQWSHANHTMDNYVLFFRGCIFNSLLHFKAVDGQVELIDVEGVYMFK